MAVRMRYCMVVLIISLGGTEIYGQEVSVGTTFGWSSIGSPGDDPDNEWGGGWNLGVGAEVRAVSFLAIEVHYRYHRLSYGGGGEYDPTVSIISQSGEPLTVSELRFGVRFYMEWLFLAVSRGQYSFDYGKTKVTYIRTGDPSPTTSERQLPHRSQGGTDFGLGATFPFFAGLTVSPQVHMSLIPRFNSPNLLTVGVGVKYEL